MNKTLISAFTGVLLLLSSCGGNEKSPSAPSLSVTLAKSEISSSGGQMTALVNWSDCKWKISEEGEGILSSFSLVYAGTEEGSGTTEVTFTVKANNSSSPRTTKVIVTSTSGSAKAEATISQEGVAVTPQTPVSVKVNSSETFQSIDGFGAMNLGSNWGKHDYWSEEETDLLMGKLGLNIMRVRISPEESDWEKLVPSIKYATSTYDALVLASPWTMPASMKDNGSLNGSTDGEYSHLKKDCYEEYALYLEKFASTMKDKGAPIYAVSVQNEPDWPATYEGCLWSADNHREFLAQWGDKITSALVATGESMKMDHSFYTPALNDEAACANIDIVAGHLYGTTPKSFSAVQGKGKRLWMSEHLLNDSWTNSTSHWDETLAMVSEMNSCMLTGWNAYIWWYGRRYYSLIGDGEEGTSRGTVLKRGYAFSQFSYYVKPGDIRTGATLSGSEDLAVSAFSGEGHLAVVIINSGNTSVENVEVDLGTSASGAKATCTSENMDRSSLETKADGNKVTLLVPSKSIVTVYSNN